MRAAVLTISTSVAGGDADDASGPAVVRAAGQAGCEIACAEVLPDDRAAIEARLRELVADGVDFVFTTGGTGLTSDDVTPEATRAVIERDVPGIAEALRAASLAHTPMSIISRGTSGVAGRTLIVNLPGNPKAVEQLFPVLAPVLRHAAATMGREGGRDAGGH